MTSPSTLSTLFVSPQERRLRSGWRLLGQMALLLFFLVLFGLPIGGLLVAFPNLSREALFVLDRTAMLLAITASVYVARRLLDRRSFASLGLYLDRHTPRDLLFGFLLPGLMMGLVYLLLWGAGWIDFQGYAWAGDGWGRALAWTTIAFVAFVLVGWQEELLARGYWLQNLAEGLNLAWALSISSALFALAHILNPHANLAAILGLFASGLFLAFGYLRTRQLWLPIGLHTGWNFFEGTVFGFPVSGGTFYSLLHHQVSGPPLITGGEFGPEAGLILLPALLLGTIAIYLFTRKREWRMENSD